MFFTPPFASFDILSSSFKKNKKNYSFSEILRKFMDFATSLINNFSIFQYIRTAPKGRILLWALLFSHQI